MEIFIKLASQNYQRLRRRIPTDSRARKAIDKATRIEHALEGIQFEGYSIPCDEDQARIILEIARQCCPDVVRDIENVIMLARQ